MPRTPRKLRRPVRVCVMTSAHPPLDTRIFHREAKTTAAWGSEVVLIAPGAPAGSVDGVRFERLPAWGGRAGRIVRWPIATWKAWRIRADIYHFHDPELLPWGLLLKWVTGSAVVYDSHEYLAESVLGRHWIPAPLRQPAARLASLVERFVARRIDGVVTVTEDMAERFADVQPSVITVKNLPPARELPDEPDERAPVVIHAGLMNVERGLDILWETARLVRERHPEAELHILGTVEWFGLPAELRERREEEWATVGVRFLGTVPFPEVAPRLTRAAVGWLPRSPEVRNNLLAWPNKLVEYMQAGLPVVASDLPTQARVVRETQCGMVAEAHTPEAHAAAICSLLEDEKLARELGANGKETARTDFTWEAEAAKLHTLYTRLGGAR